MHRNSLAPILAATLAAGFVGVVSADPAETVIGNLAVTNVVVASGTNALDAVIRAEWAADGIEKTGAGTLSIDRDKIVAYNDLPVNVREGAVALSAGGEAPAVACPTDLLARAAFWLDVGTNVVTNASGQATAWYDVRETCAEGVYGATCARALSRVADGVALPAVVQSPAGSTRPMMYFNGCTSGTWMDFRNGDGGETAFKSIRHVFLVANFQNTYGYPLGNRGGTIYLHPQVYNKTFGGVYAQTLYGSPSVAAGIFYLDGERCNPNETNLRKGVQLVETAAGRLAGGEFSRFFCAYDMSDRSGGDYIGELLVYELPLSPAERQRIEAWLMAKWGIAPHAGAVSVVTTADTEASLDDTAGNALVGGNGSVVKTGSASASFRSLPNAPLGGTVRVEGGRLVAEQAEVAYAFRPGEALHLGWLGFEENIALEHGFDEGLAAAGEAVQTGEQGVIRLAGAPKGLTKLTLKSTNVALGTAAVADACVTTGSVVYATFPDPSFENCSESNWGGKEITSGGWVFSASSETAIAVLTPRNDLPSSGNAWFYGLDSKPELIPYYQAPDGEKILMLKNKNGGCHVSTTVSVPVSGDYLLSFSGTGRQGYSNGQITLTLTDAAGQTRTVATYIHEDGTGFRPYRFRVSDLAAGSYTFAIALANTDDVTDRHAAFDDFKLRLLTRHEPGDAAWAVPNGGFEAGSPTYWDKGRLHAHEAQGWTLAQRDGSTATTDNGLDAAFVERINGVYSSDATSLHGERLLQLRGSEGRATTAAFAPPAGRYRLRLKAAKWGFNGSGYALDGRSNLLDPTLGVRILVNGDERVNAVSAAFTSIDLRAYTVPDAFSVTAGDQVQIELRQATASTTSAAAYLNLDDLELVSAEGRSGELVANGSFEQGASNWRLIRNNDATDALRCSTATTRAFQGKDLDYGASTCDGKTALLIVQIGRAEQTVRIDEPGLYRLSFWTRARYFDVSTGVSYYYAGNKVRATLTGADSAEREIYCTPRIATTNYVRHAVVFRVPAAGDYTLALQGVNNGSDVITVLDGQAKKDANAFVDAVSLRQIPAETATPPAFPPEFQLALPANGHLRLEYDGEVQFSRLTFGSQRLIGTIDATHASGLVSGPGKIVVPRHGAALILR